MKRTMLSLLTVFVLAAVGALQPAAADDGGESTTEAVSLDIRNHTDTPLRCVVILAHFVTRDLGEIAPGEALALAMERTSVPGVLAYGEHAGQPMLVENILCRGSMDWLPQRADLALTPLRADSRRHYVADCAVSGRFDCLVEAVAE